MIIAKTLEETARFLEKESAKARSCGLVPTMGALHQGHISLLDYCKAGNDTTIVSIFVNPTQFNDPEDLKNYPRDLEKDIEMLRDKGCDMIFAPNVETIYPEPDNRIFDFGKTADAMEGRFRPGHFNGVAQVVSRLLEIIKPKKAYFGEKDIQQLAIIRKMVRICNYPVEIIGCPTIRESDGLAMSSRNRLLTPAQRESAPLIYHVLTEASGKQDKEIDELKEWAAQTINSDPNLKLEYFEIVDKDELTPVHTRREGGESLLACMAVKAGNIRLIDNILLPNFA